MHSVIKVERPPNWDQIVEVFPDAARLPVLFAYGEDIYNPSEVRIPRELLAHEYRHCARQFSIGAEPWWSAYLSDVEFRYTEELMGHAEELRVLAQGVTDRNQIARLFQRTATRLVAPLYNYQPPRTVRQAVLDLRAYLDA